MKTTESKYSQKTKLREILFTAYHAGDIDKETVVKKAAISMRQFYRLQSKYLKTKDLSHGLCDRISNRCIDVKIKEEVLKYYKTTYRGCNYEHFSELLLDYHGINIKSSTLRKWLLEAELTLPKRRKPKKYTRREPKPRFNQMLQLDGTFDDFLGDGVKRCLMHLVDDATKTSLAMLFDAECTDSALEILYHWCNKYGIPESIYSDKHSTYRVNPKQHLTIEEELEGKYLRNTEFGIICERLGIKQIFAHSPQAKGRVEKKHSLYKDRFIKEIKIFGLKTMEQANQFLTQSGGFIGRLNDKFTIAAKEDRPTKVLPNPADLIEQFTIRHIRTVRNDYTVQLNNVVYQLSKKAPVNSKSKVVFKVYLDKRIAIFAGDLELEYRIIENYVRPETIVKKPAVVKIKRESPVDLSDVHIYRQNYKPEKHNQYPTRSSQLESLGRFYGA